MISKQLDEITESVEKEFRGLDVAQLNLRPAADKWSIAQCLDHLIVSNTTYMPAFDRVLSGQNKPGLWQKINPFTNLLGKKGVDFLRSRKIKVKAPDIFVPANGNIPRGIVDRFMMHQEEMKQYFDRMEKANLYNEIISSPFTKLATLKIGDVMNIIVEHERRHLDQARVVKKQCIDS